MRRLWRDVLVARDCKHLRLPVLRISPLASSSLATADTASERVMLMA